MLMPSPIKDNMPKPITHQVDALIIGGGFYGSCIAMLMSSYCDAVVLVEKEPDLLQRASSLNQARVHTGFHYPRSLVTAYRSLVNFPRFILDFKRAIVDDFTKLYAIARKGSKVNAHYFYQMYKMMKAPIKVAPPQYQRLFNKELIEEVFLVREVAFDAVILKNLIKERLEDSGVKVIYAREIEKVEPAPAGEMMLVSFYDGDCYAARYVFNCTYSQINKILKNSHLPLLSLKHEITELALVRVPEELSNIGVTVMDGPFFSIMPFPTKKLHSLSHVRYTPHYSWSDQTEYKDGHALLREKKIQSNYQYMLKDAQRYIPSLEKLEYVESLYEIKTVLMKHEVDDGRPILFKKDYGLKNFEVIMGSKIDNIYDVLEMIADAKQSLNLKKKIRKRAFFWT